MANSGSASRGLLFLLAAAGAIACRESSRTPVIGYGRERDLDLVVQLLTAELGDSLPRNLRIVTASPGDSNITATAGDVRAALGLVARPGLSGVVGAGSSRGAVATAPIYEEARVPVVVPTATSRLMRGLGPWIFSLAPDDSLESLFLARVLRTRFHARRVILFHVDDEFGTGLRDRLRAILPRDSIHLIAARPLSQLPEWCVDSGPSWTFRLVVRSALQAGRPDAVVAALRDRSTGCLLRALRDEGVTAPLIAGDGTLLLQELWHWAGNPTQDTVYAASFWHPDRPSEESRRFVAGFQARFGRLPDAGQAMRYDALRLLVAATQATGPDPAAVRDWLAALGRTTPPYPGVTGAIAFGAARSGDGFLLVRLVTGSSGPELVPP